MASRFKRAHRTHALMQPAGESYPHVETAAGPSGGAHRSAVELFAELTERVPDVAERASRIGVKAELVEAWDRGSAQPLLHAHRKALERALRSP